jgi:hypothetical protein
MRKYFYIFTDGKRACPRTAVFTQRRRFRLISYDLGQRGRTFKEPMEVSIEPATDRVTVRTVDDDGDP